MPPSLANFKQAQKAYLVFYWAVWGLNGTFKPDAVFIRRYFLLFYCTMRPLQVPHICVVLQRQRSVGKSPLQSQVQPLLLSREETGHNGEGLLKGS